MSFLAYTKTSCRTGVNGADFIIKLLEALLTPLGLDIKDLQNFQRGRGLVFLDLKTGIYI